MDPLPAVQMAFGSTLMETSGPAAAGSAPVMMVCISSPPTDSALARSFCRRFAPISASVGRNEIVCLWRPVHRSTLFTSAPRARTSAELRRRCSRGKSNSNRAKSNRGNLNQPINEKSQPLIKSRIGEPNMAATQQVDPNPIADRCRRRVMWRLMPFLFVLYVIAYLDRVNVSFGALQMRDPLATGGLGFTDSIIGLGAGIFFVGYVVLEIPGSILCEKWSARGWIARIMISWGILAMLTGFIHTKNQFYLVRFLLGAAEAGFFPGIIVYFSHWFRYQDRAKAVAILMAGISVSNIIGLPISAWLMRHTWFGLAGWRWMFIIEGAPAV